MTSEIAHVFLALGGTIKRELAKPNTPPFFGQLEISDGDREKARNVVRELGWSGQENLYRVLSKNRIFTAWYICDAVRASYGNEGYARVWPDIQQALNLKQELGNDFRKELHEIVGQACEQYGLPVPPEDMVSLFTLHAGVSDAQLPGLIRIFIIQERTVGLPPLEETSDLNAWEDGALDFLPQGRSVMRKPILWDSTAWHARIYVECRLGKFDNNSLYHQRFNKIIAEQEKVLASKSVALSNSIHRPYLILENMEVALKMPPSGSRQIVQFDDQVPLRLRSGIIQNLGYPFPRKITFGQDNTEIHIMPEDDHVLVGDADIAGRLVAVNSTSKTTLKMTNLIIHSRAKISSECDIDCDCFEVAEGIYRTVVSFPKSGQLLLKIGGRELRLLKEPYRSLHVSGEVIGRATKDALYSPNSILIVQTGIQAIVKREISVEISGYETQFFSFETSEIGEAEIPLSDLLNLFKNHNGDEVVTLKIELMNPKQTQNEEQTVSGIRKRFDVWLGFIETYGAELRCSQSPKNLKLSKSKNISLDDRGMPCIDIQNNEDIEIAFDIEKQEKVYRLQRPGVNVFHILPDGKITNLVCGDEIVINPKSRGGAIRLGNVDPEAELEIPGLEKLKPFKRKGTFTFSLRAPKSGLVKLHQADGALIPILHLNEEFSYKSVEIKRSPGRVHIELFLNRDFDAVGVEFESDIGKSEYAETYFGIDKYLFRPEEWFEARKLASGKYEIQINYQKFPEGLWLGRVCAKDQSGKHNIVAPRGDALSFLFSSRKYETFDENASQRAMRILNWLNLCHANESWKSDRGGVEDLSTKYLKGLFEQILNLPGGRVKILTASLANDWKVDGSTWMPPIHALQHLPDLFDSPNYEYYNVGGCFEALSRLGPDFSLRDSELFHRYALVSFSNSPHATNTGEKLRGFDFNKLMSILSNQESTIRESWDGKQVLGPAHWCAAHELLQDRIDETGFFSDDVEGNNSRRSLNLRRLHGKVAIHGNEIKIPKLNQNLNCQLHQDFSFALRIFAVKSRNGKTREWLSELLSDPSLFSYEELLVALGDLVRLAPELFAFHLTAAELERRK